MGTVLFYERQLFSRWVFGVSLALGLCALVLLLPSAVGNGTPLQGLVALILLIVSVVTLNLTTMSTWVDDNEIRVQIGRLPLYTKRIALAGLQEVRIVEYRPSRKTGGWGHKSGQFEGKSTRFLTMGGSQGLLAESGGHRYLVGTRRPEALCRAIERRLAELERDR